MNKRRFAQSLVEISVIGSVALGICLVGVFFFGDSLNATFEGNKIGSIFATSRTNNVIASGSPISNVNLEIGGQSYSSPIESVIKAKLEEGTYIQTSGSSGQISETAEIIDEYANTLKDLIDSLAGSFPVDPLTGKSAIDDLKDAIDAASTASTDLISTDGNLATDELTKTVKQLEFALAFTKGGDIAENLENSLLTLKNSDNYDQIDPAKRLMIDNLLNGMLALGESLEYKLDSRGDLSTVLANSDFDRATGSIEYAETLSDFKDDWTASRSSHYKIASDGSLKIQKGNYFLDTVPENQESFSIETNNLEFSTISTIGSDYGILIRATYEGSSQTPTSGYKLEQKNVCVAGIPPILCSASKPTFSLIKIDSRHSEATIASWESDESIRGWPTQSYNLDSLKIDVDGDHFSVKVDGQEVISINDATYSTGKTGITTDSMCSNLKLDSLKVGTLRETSLKHLELSTLKQDLENILNDDTISQEAKAQLAKEIDIYRSGAYSEIVPESYNNEVLCSSIGGSVSSGSCQLQ